jgi:Na+-driven multidrug efflux pump
MAEGRRYLWVAAWQHLPAAFCIAIAGAINGAGRMVAPMLLDLAGFAGLLLPALLIAHWTRAPLGTVWLLLVVGQLLLAVAYAQFVERRAWTEPPPGAAGPLSA